MDLAIKSHYYYIHDSQSLSPPLLKSPPNSQLFGSSSSHSSHSGFPIIAVAIIGILATAFLLVSYYIFVIKCCLNWHRIDLLRRFSLSRNRNARDPLMARSPGGTENRGLDESVIRSIPVFQFKNQEKARTGERDFNECSVCLNEFQEEEKLRIIPNCGHVFHIDCIDVWLQRNEKCPLCRTSISLQLPVNPGPHSDNFLGRDEDYVVIELGEPNRAQQFLGAQERLRNSEESSSPSPRKGEPKFLQKKAKKPKHVTSMGDECIDMRGRDGQFAIQKMRRSFSMDSASDQQLYLAVQEILQQNRHFTEVSSSEACSSSRVKRSFFSFGHGRGSRSSVLPIHFEA